MKQLLIIISAILIIGCDPTESDLALKKRVCGEYIHLKIKWVFDEDGTVKTYDEDGNFGIEKTWYVKRGKIYVVNEGWSEKYRLRTWKELDNGNLARYFPPPSDVWIPAVKIVK